MDDLRNYRRVADAALREYHAAKSQLTRERVGYAAAKQAHADCLDAQKIVQATAAAVQERAHEQIARVVTAALKTVFGEGAYEFRVHFDRKRGRTEARFTLRRGGHDHGPLDSCGGGVVDVTGFALRLASVLLAVPARRRLLVLDEPFRFVSAGYRPRVRELVETLARELNVQVIITTHSRELVCGKVVEIGGDGDGPEV